MRGKNDTNAETPRRGRRRKATTRKSPPGGKALRRLLIYLAERDPVLIGEVVDTAPMPKAPRRAVGPAQQAMRTRSTRSVRAVPKRNVRAPAHAKRLAAAMAKAAKARTPKAPKRTVRRRTRGMAPPGPPTAAAWQELGPRHIPDGQTYGSARVDVIGRVSAIAVDPADPTHLLCGSAGGGIWESQDTGATWIPTTDQMPTLAIGAVTFDPHDSTRVYAGTGEGNFYANLGVGVYRSNDGGTTWTLMAGTSFVGIGFYDLVVDPVDPKTLYAATTNGFYMSPNSGVSWSLKRPAKCWDITVHPSGGTTEILASFADGLFASANGGNSFTAVALPSAPAGAWVRLAVDRVTASPDVAYAFGASGNTPHLWRRAGTTWTKITSLATMNVSQAWYDWYVAASPADSGEVFLGAIDAFRGKLSGANWTWKNISTQGQNSIHPDQHCLTFSPDNPKIIYAGNDGGIYRSPSSGASWKELNRGLGITEIEYLASDPNLWTWLMAGTQDNGTIRFTGTTKWDHIADGDGGDCGVNQLNPNEVYHSYYNVTLERSNNKGDTWTSLSPPNMASLFYPPVEVSGATVAIGGVSLVITRTGGPPWTTVSLGLPSGDGASAMRAIDANTFLIGTTKGRMLCVAWNGTSWSVTNLTSPAARYISCIAVDPSNPLRLWVTYSQIGGGRVFRSDDAGATWTDCTSGLPGIPMNAVVVDPANFKRVWVSADVGVYQTDDLGSTWTNFSTGLPNAMAVDLLFHKQDRMLICGTRNRGAWAIKVP
jgi:photosystem II stability/assembly factor-like uncharacterized protein